MDPKFWEFPTDLSLSFPLLYLLHMWYPDKQAGFLVIIQDWTLVISCLEAFHGIVQFLDLS